MSGAGLEAVGIADSIQNEAADAIVEAASTVLDQGIYTADLTGDRASAVGTAEMGDVVIAALLV